MSLHKIDYIDERDDWALTDWIWLAAGAVLVATVVFLQWFTRDLGETHYDAAPAHIRNSESLDGVRFGDFALAAKAYLKTRAHAVNQRTIGDADAEWMGPSPESFLREEIEPLAVTRTQRLWSAILAGELLGKAEALTRIDALLADIRAQSGEPSALASDADWFRKIYAEGSASLSDEAQRALLARHQWFAQVAMAFDRPLDDGYRTQTFRGGKDIESSFLAIGTLNGLMTLAGIGAAAWLITKLKDHRSIFHEQISGTTHYLHAFIIFVGVFAIVLGLSLLPFGMGVEGSAGALVFNAALPWGLCAALAWPLFRHVQWDRFREHVGLHAGAGIGKEIGIGFLAFLAEIPIMVALSLVISVFVSSDPSTPTGTPMMESPNSDSPLAFALFALGAVVWAPLVEEIAFRGLLYGALRARLDAFLSVFISAALFGLVHPYSPAGMIPVAAGGVLYALLREWRGSLIASMTAHLLHNGSLVLTVWIVTRAIGG